MHLCATDFRTSRDTLTFGAGRKSSTICKLKTLQRFENLPERPNAQYGARRYTLTSLQNPRSKAPLGRYTLVPLVGQMRCVSKRKSRLR